MRLRLLDFLACPTCRSSALTPEGREQRGVILEGALRCACGAAYPIRNGIPRMQPATGIDRDTARSFGIEWLSLGRRANPWGVRLETVADTLRHQIFPDQPLTGQSLLDAGCATGRNPAIFARLGLEVVGLELSEAIEEGPHWVRELAEGNGERVHFVQGTIEAPPLRQEVFDLAFSSGVLHHTRSTEKSFHTLAGLVKPGGDLYVWLYQVLPPELERQLAKRRAFVHRFPMPLRYPVCSLIAWYDDLRLQREAARNGRRLHPTGCFRERAMNMFDAIAPIRRHHTPEEVFTWFKEAGYPTPVEITDPTWAGGGFEVVGRRGRELPARPAPEDILVSVEGMVALALAAIPGLQRYRTAYIARTGPDDFLELLDQVLRARHIERIEYLSSPEADVVAAGGSAFLLIPFDGTAGWNQNRRWHELGRRLGVPVFEIPPRPSGVYEVRP